MAQTFMADTGRKTWEAIAPVRGGGGAWHREVANVTEGLPMAAHIPTGGWYSGYGAVLSHSYAQQFVNQPTPSSMPGYWQGGGSAGGTQLGQMTRSHGYQGFGDIADDIQKLTEQYNALAKAGQSSQAASVKVTLDALRKKAEAEEGTDWMNLLTKLIDAGTTVYATERTRLDEARARRRARASGDDYVSTQYPTTTGGGGGYVPPAKSNTGLYVGLGVAGAALLGLLAWKL